MDEKQRDKLDEALLNDDEYARLAIEAYEASQFQTDRLQAERAWKSMEGKIAAAKPQISSKNPGSNKALVWGIPILLAAGLSTFILLRPDEQPVVDQLDYGLKSGSETGALEVTLSSKEDGQAGWILNTTGPAYAALLLQKADGSISLLNSLIALPAHGQHQIEGPPLGSEEGRLCVLYADSEAALQTLISRAEQLLPHLPEGGCIALR